MIARRLLVVLACGCAVAGCELDDVTIERPTPIVVAEAILRAGIPTQRLFLHRSHGGRSAAGPSGKDVFADVSIVEQGGDTLLFDPSPISECLDGRPPGAAAPGTCYSQTKGPRPKPGAAYHLRVRTVEDEELTSRTVMPGPFSLLRPRVQSDTCRIPPNTTLELTWTRSSGAWVYAAQVEYHGLQAALAPFGIDLPVDEAELIALAIGEADTTIVFPSEFGIFDRADERLAPLLIASRNGLPEGVFGKIVVAAADRNYVNWVRGGTFNPSGRVRIPSVSGDGTGVFGSLVPRTFNFRVTSGRPEMRLCDAG